MYKRWMCTLMLLLCVILIGCKEELQENEETGTVGFNLDPYVDKEESIVLQALSDAGYEATLVDRDYGAYRFLEMINGREFRSYLFFGSLHGKSCLIGYRKEWMLPEGVSEEDRARMMSIYEDLKSLYGEPYNPEKVQYTTTDEFFEALYSGEIINGALIHQVYQASWGDATGHFKSIPSDLPLNLNIAYNEDASSQLSITYASPNTASYESAAELIKDGSF